MRSLSRTRPRTTAPLYLRILITLCLPGLLSAQTPAKDDEKGKVTLPGTEEVVVTATRTEDKLATTPANVTVIDERDIANSTAQDIAGLLRTQVGVQVSDLTGNRRTYRVDLRGFGETGQSSLLSSSTDGGSINPT